MSWQASLFCIFLRWTIKRASAGPIDVAKARASINKPRRRTRRIAPGFAVSAVHVDGLVFEHIDRAAAPALRQDRAILYLHGGGYIFCSPQSHRPITLAMAAHADAPVWALDYRLAPEHKLPAALDDAIAAYRWLAAAEPARRIVLAGDSAGGGLALATAIALRDLAPELPPPIALVLFSPWADLGGTGGSNISNEKSCAMFTNAMIKQAGQLYLGAAEPADPRASPLFGNLHDLPPMQIFASADELLLDDSRRLAAKAHAEGVTVDLHIVPGVPHVWPLFARFLPEGRATLLQVRDFLKRLMVSPNLRAAPPPPAG